MTTLSVTLCSALVLTPAVSRFVCTADGTTGYVRFAADVNTGHVVCDLPAGTLFLLDGWQPMVALAPVYLSTPLRPFSVVGRGQSPTLAGLWVRQVAPLRLSPSWGRRLAVGEFVVTREGRRWPAAGVEQWPVGLGGGQ